MHPGVGEWPAALLALPGVAGRVPVQGALRGDWVNMAAAQPHTFSGQDFALQRDKNRFVLPSQFRKALKARNQDSAATMLLMKHNVYECLIGFADDHIARLNAQIDREEELASRSGRDFDRFKRSVEVHAYVSVPFDGSGRFVLPDRLSKLAKVDGQVFFNGAGDFFTMWARDEVGKLDDSWANIKDACESLAEQELAKAGAKAEAGAGGA